MKKYTLNNNELIYAGETPASEVSTNYAHKLIELKQQLSDSDYKIIKAYEMSLVGKTVEYDMAALHMERQAIRDEINRIDRLIEYYD